MAKAQRDYELKKAAYDIEVNTRRAQADLAYQLQVRAATLGRWPACSLTFSCLSLSPSQAASISYLPTLILFRLSISYLSPPHMMRAVKDSKQSAEKQRKSHKWT
jgi:hypothetical protein